MSEPKYVFVLGNGFDLDLGCRTSYRAFVESTKLDGGGVYQFFHKDAFSPLQQYLIEAYKIERWFDLENELKKYAVYMHSKYPYGVPEDILTADKHFFSYLTLSLGQHIKHNAQIRPYITTDYGRYPIETCYAFHFLRHWQTTSNQFRILTFNYSDPNNIMGRRIIEDDKIVYIHGKASNPESLILGFNEIPNAGEYSFMIKDQDVNYVSHPVTETLINASDIIFFGLSFGNIDSCYFEDFFASLIASKGQSRKNVTIITRDDNSVTLIRESLFDMGFKLRKLRDYSNFQFIRTADNIPKNNESFKDLMHRMGYNGIN